MPSSATTLEEIRARAGAALPGPWGWMGNTEGDRIHLSTRHSGQLTILDADTRTVEYVFDHDAVESYSVDRAREQYLKDVDLMPEARYAELSLEQLKALTEKRELTVVNAEDAAEEPIEDDYVEAHCGWDVEHGFAPGGFEPDWGEERALQEELRDFLRPGEMDPDEGSRHLARGSHAWLVRGVMVRPDMRFGVDHLLRSYRDLARYEVLDGRTRAEHAAAGGTIDGERRDLYRHSIVGIDTPEAEFIAHARSDVDWLLAEVDRLTRLVPDRRWWLSVARVLERLTFPRRRLEVSTNG